MHDSRLAASIIEDRESAVGAACLACRRSGAQVFFEMSGVPVLCNAPCADRDAALRFPTGHIELAFCPDCGSVFNRAFRPELMIYDQHYENSLHYSGQFDQYIRGLASGLVSRLGLNGKDIIEIGCGKGDFLAMLCEIGNNRGVGFDPSYEPDRLDHVAAGRLRIVRDLYGEGQGHVACDFLCCRQTLEHIPDPAEFLKSVRRALARGYDHATVFFEVPNALYTLRHKGIWDIIYEHVSYFWSVPLSRLFTECGFAVRSVQETYGRQFLCIEAAPAANGPATPAAQVDAEEVDRVAEEARQFGETFRSTVRAAAEVLENVQRRNQHAVIWGAGSKGVTFLNLFRNFECLEHAVDINPHKQGKYVPGTGHRIVAPEFLSKYRPDIVFVMNPLYRQEIAERLADLSVRADLVSV